MPLISGVNITLGGQDYIIPPLNFAALKHLQSTIETLSNISATMTASQIDAVADIVLAAMLRNYPNTKKEDVLDWLDLGNAGTILSAIMGQSGVKPVGEQENRGYQPIDWDALYAHLITSIDWTWEYIDEYMTLPRLSVLSTYWQNHPPVHISVAAFIGIRSVGQAVPEALAFLNLPEYED